MTRGFGASSRDAAYQSYGCNFEGALDRLRPTKVSKQTTRPTAARRTASKTSVPVNQLVKPSDDTHNALLNDPKALAHLRSTRGVDPPIVKRFRIGITGRPGKRYWTFPIADASGLVVAVKHHRADGQDRKCFWKPRGMGRDHLWPIFLAPPAFTRRGDSCMPGLVRRSLLRCDGTIGCDLHCLILAPLCLYARSQHMAINFCALYFLRAFPGTGSGVRDHRRLACRFFVLRPDVAGQLQPVITKSCARSSRRRDSPRR